MKSFSINHVFNVSNKKRVKLLLYSLLIGIIVGLTGAAFRIILSNIESLRNYINQQTGIVGWLAIITFVVIGITLAIFLVKKFAPEASGSGVHEIEGALDGLRPMRWKRVLPIKFIASLFSLGSGLLLGREGPTVQIGANIGKMVKDLFKESDIGDNPLVSVGSAAGLACAFNAPLAGIIFVIEEMHDHFKFNFYSVAAIMIGSGSSDIVVRSIIGSSPIIKMSIYPNPILSELWLFVPLGIFFSLIGYMYNHLLIKSLNFFQNSFVKPILLTGAVAGIIIAIIGKFYPEMLGGGYDVITKVINHSFTFYFLIVLFLARMLLSIFSYSIGAPGGIFAPLLVLGVILGMLFESAMNHYFPGSVLHPGIFAVAGMAGIFASTIRAPLTGIVLAVEITSNFELLLPLIITTVTASVLTTLIGNKPIYTTLLERALANTKSTDSNMTVTDVL